MNGGNEMKRRMLTKWFGIISLIIMLLGVSIPQAAAEIIHQEKFQMNWNYIKFKSTVGKLDQEFSSLLSEFKEYIKSLPDDTEKRKQGSFPVTGKLSR